MSAKKQTYITPKTDAIEISGRMLNLIEHSGESVICSKNINHLDKFIDNLVKTLVFYSFHTRDYTVLNNNSKQHE